MNIKGEISFKDAVAIGFGGIFAILTAVADYFNDPLGLFAFLITGAIYWIDSKSTEPIAIVFLLWGLIKWFSLGETFGGIIFILISLAAFFMDKLFR